MDKKRLDIPWTDILSSRDDRAPEVVVVGQTVASGRGGGGGEASLGEGQMSAMGLTDLQLRERIERVQMNIDKLSSRLPDNGKKFHASLRILQEEEGRRKFARRQKKDVDELDRRSSTKIGSLKELKPNSSQTQSYPQSEFGVGFCRGLDSNADTGTSAAFSEELKCFSQDKKHARQNLPHVHERRQDSIFSSRPSPFGFLSNILSKDKQSSSVGDTKGIASFSNSSFEPRSLSKRRAPENCTSLDVKSTKVQDVVLLDEEDIQPIEPIQEANELEEWKEVKIYYPSRDHPECVELCYSDIKCLAPQSYLSSTIMNFYILYLQRPSSLVGRPRGDYHFFNTYFYNKLEEAMSSKGDHNACFIKLRRWWKGINIFQKAYIFLPIHGEQHWSLVIICIPAKEDESGPIILHLDSLGFHASTLIFNIIESFLKEEWNCVSQNFPPDLPFTERIWKNLPRRIEKKNIMVPQQKNEYDCGLFVLYFMQRFIEEAPERAKKKDLSKFGSKWFKSEEASGLRDRIHDLLREELESSRLMNGITESPESSGGSEDTMMNDLKNESRVSEDG